MVVSGWARRFRSEGEKEDDRKEEEETTGSLCGRLGERRREGCAAARVREGERDGGRTGGRRKEKFLFSFLLFK